MVAGSDRIREVVDGGGAAIERRGEIPESGTRTSKGTARPWASFFPSCDATQRISGEPGQVKKRSALLIVAFLATVLATLRITRVTRRVLAGT